MTPNETKTYSTAALFLSLLIGLIIGYLIGIYTANTDTAQSVRDSGSEVGGVMTDGAGSDESTTAASISESELVSGDPNEVAFTIEVATLSAAQRTALRTAGVSGDELVITKGMIACSEAEIGAERMVAIQNGETPSISEGVAIVGCYSSN